MTKPDPERIWLQNAEDAKQQCEGRLWCEHKVWPAGDDPEEGEPTEYIRADIHARALLEAKRRGMERAAKIAEGEVYHHRYRTWPFWPEQKDGTRGNISNESEIARHCDNIAAAIRAAAKEIDL